MKRLAFVLLGTAVCAVAALACQETPGTEFPIEPGTAASGAASTPNPPVDASFPQGMDGPITDATASDAPKLFNDAPEL